MGDSPSQHSHAVRASEVSFFAPLHARFYHALSLSPFFDITENLSPEWNLFARWKLERFFSHFTPADLEVTATPLATIDTRGSSYQLCSSKVNIVLLIQDWDAWKQHPHCHSRYLLKPHTSTSSNTKSLAAPCWCNCSFEESVWEKISLAIPESERSSILTVIDWLDLTQIQKARWNVISHCRFLKTPYHPRLVRVWALTL